MTDETSNHPDDAGEYNVELDERLKLVHQRLGGEPQRAQLFSALALAQGEIQAAETSKEVEVKKDGQLLYKFKYADLADCLAVIREPLSKNGLALIQIPSLGDENAVNMETILGHESGQQISCFMTMYPEKPGPQAIGTVMSYLRRYSLCAIVGVAQFDDDAASATKGADEYERLTPRDIDEVLVLADELFGEDADAVLESMVETIFDKKHLADIPKDQLKFALTRLRNKKNRDDKKARDTKKADKGAETKESGAETLRRLALEGDKREPGTDDE